MYVYAIESLESKRMSMTTQSNIPCKLPTMRIMNLTSAHFHVSLCIV